MGGLGEGKKITCIVTNSVVKLGLRRQNLKRLEGDEGVCGEDL